MCLCLVTTYNHVTDINLATRMDKDAKSEAKVVSTLGLVAGINEKLHFATF